jgi:hypothetical protein
MLPVIAVFLFLAVWLPCCASDIAFPLMWVRHNQDADSRGVQEDLHP